MERELKTLLDLVRVCRGRETYLMESKSREKLYKIVDKFRHIKSADTLDSIFTFYMTAIETLTIEPECDEDVALVKEICPGYRTLENDDLELDCDVVYKITIGKCSEKSENPLSYIVVKPYLPDNVLELCWLDNTCVVSTKSTWNSDELPDETNVNAPYGRVYDISNILDIIDEYLGDKLESEVSVAQFNENNFKLVPFKEKSYLLKRSDCPWMKYNTEEMKPLLDIVKKYVKPYETLYGSYDEEFVKLTLEEKKKLVRITPETYCFLWNRLHKGSYKKSDEELSETLGVEMPDKVDDEHNYFYYHNSKGHNLIDLIKRDEDWQNPDILVDWESCNTMFHCEDVIYARTHLRLKDYGKAPLIYNCATHWHIESFLESIIYLDNEVNQLGKDITDVFAVSDTTYNIMEDIFLNRDVIHFGGGYEDKYIRTHSVSLDGDELPQYCDATTDLLEFDKKEFVKENGKELPWSDRLQWLG